jgi:hypothetical protein
VDEVLPRMVQKTLNLHVFSNLASIATISCSFDLWMFKGQLQCGHFCPSDKFYE